MGTSSRKDWYQHQLLKSGIIIKFERLWRNKCVNQRQRQFQCFNTACLNYSPNIKYFNGTIIGWEQKYQVCSNFLRKICSVQLIWKWYYLWDKWQ